VWPTTRDISQRAEPDVRPLGHAVSTFIAEKTRRLTIPLTGDVPLQHLMCPIHSAGRWRPSHPTGGGPIHCQTVRPCYEVHCAPLSSHERCQGSFPCTPMLRRSWILGCKKITLGTNVSRSKYYIRYVPGPTCWSSVPLYVPPLSYKRGGMLRYRGGTDSLRLKLTSNTIHSGVGYYALAARTTLNPCVFLCVHPPNL
jgi:hypothetical protein